MRKTTIFLTVILLTSTAAAQSLTGLFSGNQDSGEAALIDLSGAITPSAAGFSSGITPEQVRDLNQRAEQQNVDAIIYEINSGGGAVVASKEIKRSIESLDTPTICRIRDVGASGAYLFSLGCDRIVADSASITGSVGVSSSYLEFSDLLEKAGINYVNITAGERKQLSNPYEQPTEEEKQILQEKAETIDGEFINEVDESRNLTQNQRETVGTGEIFLGSEAIQLNLIDQTGGRETAVEEAENMTGKQLSTVKVSEQSEVSLLSLFFSDLRIGSGESPLKAVL